MSEPINPLFKLDGNRGVIDLRQVESIEPYGEYPDECTLVMRSGRKWSVGAGYAGSRSHSVEHWSRLVNLANTQGD